MNKLYPTLILVLALFASCQQKKQLPSIVPLESDWSFRSMNSNDWFPATVPGNIYSDLISSCLAKDFMKTINLLKIDTKTFFSS